LGAAALLNGEIYIIGGETYGGGGYPQGYTDCVEVYNPKTDTWRFETFLPERMGDVKAETSNGKIYVVGLGKLLIFDPQTHSWEYGPPPLIYRSEPGMATLQGKIYVFGG
jgi:N-acetylneuraminic acid mutarotase